VTEKTTKASIYKNCWIPVFFAIGILTVCSASAMANDVKVEWKWKEGHECYTKSPQINLKNVPAGTAKLSISMVDLDFTGFDHGGGDVDYGGKGIVPEGALSYYKGPCPPDEHRYEITVIAQDKTGKTLGKGVGMRECCDQFK
jgi:phosphatidylethanolamine-binding protein (PEBP) family uncharacterized protein